MLVQLRTELLHHIRLSGALAVSRINDDHDDTAGFQHFHCLVQCFQRGGTLGGNTLIAARQVAQIEDTRVDLSLHILVHVMVAVQNQSHIVEAAVVIQQLFGVVQSHLLHIEGIHMTLAAVVCKVQGIVTVAHGEIHEGSVFRQTLLQNLLGEY